MKKYHKFYLTALLIAGIIIPGFYISNAAEKKNVPWKFPDESKIPKGEEGKLVVYGKNLVAETHKYLGRR